VLARLHLQTMSEDHLSRFTGESDVDYWISLVEAVAKTHKWEAAVITSQALLHLSGQALLWAQNSGAISADSWDNLKEQLLLRYREQLNEAALRNELNKIKRQRGESLLTYSDRLQAVFKKAKTPLNESAKIEHLLRGLPKEMQFLLYVRTRDITTTTFMGVVRLVNDFEALNLIVEAAPGSSAGSAASSSAASSASVPVVKCSYCGKANHLEKDCRKKKLDEHDRLEAQGNLVAGRTRSETRSSTAPSASGVTCKYCKNPGHDLSTCPKLKEKEEKKLHAIAQQGQSE